MYIREVLQHPNPDRLEPAVLVSSSKTNAFLCVNDNDQLELYHKVLSIKNYLHTDLKKNAFDFIYSARSITTTTTIWRGRGGGTQFGQVSFFFFQGLSGRRKNDT